MSISISSNMIDIIGYTGGSIFAVNSIPHIFTVVKKHINIDVPEQQINTGMLISNTIAGTLLIIYGVIQDIKPIYMSFAMITCTNLIGILIKIWYMLPISNTQHLY